MADHRRRVATTVTGAVLARGPRRLRPGSADVSSAVSAATAVVPAGSATVRVRGQLPPVAADQGRLEHVLAALVESAWLRTPPGARVFVEAAVVPDAAGAPGRLRVRIADRGPDVAAAARPWMLASLHALHRPDGGPGRITVEDNPGGGLVHVLTLPVAP